MPDQPPAAPVHEPASGPRLLAAPWRAGARYLNLDGRRIPPAHSFPRFLRWRFGRRAAPELPGALDRPAEPVAPHAAWLAQPEGLQITWLGHATCLIQVGGRAILTDPVFGPVALGAVRRLAPPPLALDALPHLDAICVSHNHYDHCDRPSLRALRARFPEALLVAPPGLDAWLTQHVGGPVASLPWFESLRLDGPGTPDPVTLRAVPAQHWSTRGPHDLCRTHWCGFVVRGEAGAVYFAGDTGFGPHFEAIAADQPQLTAALLPIGAYAPRWFMADQHMGPQEAVAAARILGAHLLPIHWGTYRLTDEPLDEPPRLALTEAEAQGVPITLLSPGGIWRGPARAHGRWRWPGEAVDKPRPAL